MFRGTRGLAWIDSSTWIFVLLVALTLVPSACVLWFMNAAMTNESIVARQRVEDAYRGQLRLVRSRLDGVWRTQAAKLAWSGDPAQVFARIVADGAADGAVLLDEQGRLVYPSVSDSARDVVASQLRREVIAASALQPDARVEAIQAIGSRLDDYTQPMAASTRLALMEQLRAASPNVWITTQSALRLSLDLVAVERPMPAADIVRRTALDDVWALTSSDRRVIALYRTGRLEGMMHDFLHEISPAGVVFVAYPPDERADANAVAAGPWLPGWQLSFVPLAPAPFDEDATRRRTTYLAVAVAGIALITIGGAVVSSSLRRHLRLARLKTDLVAAASHELRTPVASMRVLVDGLLADETLDPVRTREYLQLLSVENSRLGRRIESFLTFARLDRRRYRFALTSVSPACIVATAVEDVRERIPPDCHLDVDVEQPLPPVHADSEALVTALGNLLDNAVKYTPDDKKIALRVRREGEGMVSFAVSDNGIGIAAGERRRIFRRFYQVDQRLSRETGGVGLGLSIVMQIVRGHRGRLDVESEPGRGSTFTMRIPAAREARA